MKLNWLILTLLLASCGRETTVTPGPASFNCSVQDNSKGALVSCPDGTTAEIDSGAPGLPGVTGFTGSQGVVGNTGADGVPGTPGSVITVVQFCPGYTESYGTFAEFGWCLGGTLFAVYDGGANDVFLSELPLGAYSSTSTGAPCSFTVGASCAVSQ